MIPMTVGPNTKDESVSDIAKPNDDDVTTLVVAVAVVVVVVLPSSGLVLIVVVLIGGKGRELRVLVSCAGTSQSLDSSQSHAVGEFVQLKQLRSCGFPPPLVSL
jgi:hypothetical protein